jgi:hypothetical protein
LFQPARQAPLLGARRKGRERKALRQAQGERVSCLNLFVPSTSPLRSA